MAAGEGDALRWRRLDFAMPRVVEGMMKHSGESLYEDVALKARLFTKQSNILCGRHIIWMITAYFKRNRCLKEQHTW